MPEKTNTKYPIISCFTGGGFLDMGFEQTGFFEVVWTNEKNPIFAEMYECGYTSWKNKRGYEGDIKVSHIGSIESISPNAIKNQAFGENVPQYFGIIGGSPCQDFSSSGKNAGFNGERGRLTKVFFDYIKAISPSFFLVENVKNLYNRNVHRKELENILTGLKNEYFVDLKILNAIHYGVPQDRERLFIIGIKKPYEIRGSFMEYDFTFPEPPVKKEYQNALTKYTWSTVDEFQNGVERPKDIPKELYVKHCLLLKKEEEKIENGNEYFKPYSQKFWKVKEGDTKGRSFKRLHRYRFSPTACYGNNEVHLHPFLPRRLSVREVLRIQSVPDSYVLPPHISLTQKFKMIGNAVPFKLAHAVAETLKTLLENHYIKEKENGII
jgi:DNA (cytosine-5)-methyltransferase 1